MVRTCREVEPCRKSRSSAVRSGATMASVGQPILVVTSARGRCENHGRSSSGSFTKAAQHRYDGKSTITVEWPVNVARFSGPAGASRTLRNGSVRTKGLATHARPFLIQWSNYEMDCCRCNYRCRCDCAQACVVARTERSHTTFLIPIAFGRYHTA